LAEDFVANLCVLPDVEKLRRDASIIIGNASQTVIAMHKIRMCLETSGQLQVLAAFAEKGDVGDAARSVENCIVSQIEVLKQPLLDHNGNMRSIRTLLIGATGSAGVGIGGETALGIAFDLSGKLQPRVFTTFGWSFGAQAQVGAAGLVSLSFEPLERGVSEGQSIGASVEVGIGVGASADFKYGNVEEENLLTGVTVTGGIGAGADFGALHRTRTEFY
jgi:hypothetical protein